jgi:hypothetical protein
MVPFDYDRVIAFGDDFSIPQRFHRQFPFTFDDKNSLLAKFSIFGPGLHNRGAEKRIPLSFPALTPEWVY